MTTRESLKSDLNSSNLVPCVALLTAWTKDRDSLGFWGDSVRLLLDRGVSYLLCMGEYAECLHDEIDEFLYLYDEELGAVRSVDIVTSYHTDESVEDVFAYFVHGTELRQKNCCLVAILGNSAEDMKIEDFVKSSATP